jgi:hypothetical protein
MVGPLIRPFAGYSVRCMATIPSSRILVPVVGLMMVLAASPALAQSYFADQDAAVPDGSDADIELLDMHLGLHSGANVGAAAFGTVSLVMGIDQFANRQIFSGLTFSLWGAATLISTVTATESAVRQWKELRPALAEASETERRLFRVREADRLTRLSINRAIGLAADGASLGIGIALLASPAPQASVTRDLATSLVMNGAFLLGVDAFRTGLDDQVARRWRLHNESAERGYFSQRPPRSRGLAGLSPWVTPSVSFAPSSTGQAQPRLVPGGVLGFTAIY